MKEWDRERWKASLKNGRSEESAQLLTRGTERKDGLTICLSLECSTTLIPARKEPPPPVESPKDAVNTIKIHEVRNKVRLDASAKKILEPGRERKGADDELGSFVFARNRSTYCRASSSLMRR